MRSDARQYLSKICIFVDAGLLSGPIMFRYEGLHSLQASIVQWFQNIEGGKQERPGPAGRIENGRALDYVPKRPKQFGALAIFNHILRKLVHVEVQRDQIIDIADLTGGKLGSHVFISLAARDDLAPGLRRQRVIGRCRIVPPFAQFQRPNCALPDRLMKRGRFKPGCNVGWQFKRPVERFTLLNKRRVIAPRDAVSDRGKDVAVRLTPQQIPDGRPVWIFKCDFAFFPRGIEQKGDDRIFPDVSGDVLSGVIRPHLLLVDVLLKYVPQHVGIYLLVVLERALIKMPLVLIEVVEHALERRVGNFDVLSVAVRMLQFVNVEQAAVQVRNVAKQLFKLETPFASTQSFMKEAK